MPAIGNMDIPLWCILRTSGRHTLPLAASLNETGFTAWTPIAHICRREYRARNRLEYDAPLTPTFVFAHADRLSDLIELSSDTRKEQPDFSVFHYLDKIPLLADHALDGLRASEARSVPLKRQHSFNAGDTVRVTQGGFEGMSGVVEDGQGRYTLVCFGRMSVKISTFLLRQDGASNSPPQQRGPAAQAA